MAGKARANRENLALQPENIDFLAISVKENTQTVLIAIIGCTTPSKDSFP
jgi:hypothetical protein